VPGWSIVGLGALLVVSGARGSGAVGVDLAPVADTYIEVGDEADRPHGDADELEVDSDSLAYAYLKFDLRSVTGVVTAATLTLHCTEHAPIGGTVYPVGDSTWIEGEDSGDDDVPGLRWTDVDTDEDEKITAGDRSPWVPDFARPLVQLPEVVRDHAVTVDVTAAFQAGPALYTLAIAGDLTDSTSYGARESGERAPRLHLELAPPPLCLDAASCDDGNPCTDDVCDPLVGCGHAPSTAPSCVPDPCAAASCVAPDVCQVAHCDRGTGQCVISPRPDGTDCDDGDRCTRDDVCRTGRCEGVARRDRDGDGVCDLLDVCPGVADAKQSDADHDGVGDACECSAPGRGRCAMGGGNGASDCLLEVKPLDAGTLQDGRSSQVLACGDGDGSCDRDAVRDGGCAFAVTLCLVNLDPRLPGCTPDDIRSVQVLAPQHSDIDRRNAGSLEHALATLGLTTRRQGRLISARATSAEQQSRCSAPVELRVGGSVADAPGPVRDLLVRASRLPNGARRWTFRTRAETMDGRRDRDRFVLACDLKRPR
jgi:hypothetical protein